MSLYYVLFLAIVQGITEFLPVSSSAHLILGRDLATAIGLPLSEQDAADQLAFDIALHVGSLGAVVLYFRRDIGEMMMGALDCLRGRKGPRFHLFLITVVATLPIIIIGFLAKDVVTNLLRSTEIIAWMTILFGIALWWADRSNVTRREPTEITTKQACLVGLMQCLAIIPGVSRSGITMTAGRLLGFDRPLSARFALLLSLPTILGAGLMATYDLYQSGDARLTADAILGGGFAFLAAWAAVVLMMRWLNRASYLPFVIYRIALGLLLLGLIYGTS
ncbi:undecaprenyl-diphosphate phosphatase [Serratia sp. NPDC078593]|uniref:undecaprenyl-diphosphate phosphatase n=1 Tax=unclassified Serratia (in: enterobacteria) TaxID=2647522 RepID=UPI0037D47157